MADAKIVIVGAGPAGVRAAEAVVTAGLTPWLIDEGRRDGGQIFRRQPEGFRRSYAELYGGEAERAAALHRAFESLADRIDYRPETLAWNLRDGVLHTAKCGLSDALPFDALIIASGAADRLMPLPGWTLPGVYSLGGAQIALKAQAAAIGRKVAFLGTGPLLYLVASQYLAAGAGVSAVLDSSPRRLGLRALPELLARPRLMARGLAMIAGLRRAGVEIRTGVTPRRIDGDEEGVSGLTVALANGRKRTIDCDAVAMGYHLRPEMQLADLARCSFRFDAASRQWLPEVDDNGRSSVEGIYLAGDGSEVLGAEAAEIGGRLAALTALHDLGEAVPPGELSRLRRKQARMRRFARGLAKAYPWPHTSAAGLADETILCRCEAVTVGELRRSVGDLGAGELNRAKAFSRVGMGRCQGRYCGHAAGEVMAAASGLPLEQVGRLRGQAPVKPLPIVKAVEPA